jgi:hypothetical protein
MTQNRIGGRDIGNGVRQQKMVEVVVALPVTLIGRAEREGDLTIQTSRSPCGRASSDRRRSRQPRLELIDRRLIIFVAAPRRPRIASAQRSVT